MFFKKLQNCCLHFFSTMVSTVKKLSIKMFYRRNSCFRLICLIIGEEDFLVKIPETRRVLDLMEAVRESARTGNSIPFER